ncbi:MAG: hypothetical protein IKY83_00110 [Proteobacteria bacterium]|nr:hypothetical protein [Pseudomonadota bacterium]
MRRALWACLLVGTWLCGCSNEGGMTPDGGSCVFDDDCRSGVCDNEVCRARDGSGGSIPNGMACTSNAQCASNNCYEGKVCRAPNWGGNSKLAIGDSCTSDAQCSSKSCKNGFCISAGTKIENGQACTSNEQCESNNCYEGKVCRTPNWGGDAKLDVGSVCSGNDKCASGNCVSGVCNPAGVKDAKTANGKACTSDSQCASSNCYEGKVCRAANWGGSSNKVGNGQACTADDQCVSNNCYEGKVCRSPNWGGSTKLDIGDACTSNDQCESAYCYQNTCKSKSGSTVTTSDANKKYCDAMLNECSYTGVYRNYDGCVETMDILRTLAPKCTKEWDNAYTCIAAQTCYDIRTYNDPITEIGPMNYVPAYSPDACDALVQAYVDCRY